MNFDDLYMLKLSIKISDFENSMKYYKKINKKKIDKELSDIITNYCTDLKIFQIFSKDKFFIKNSMRHYLNLLKTPVNNIDIIQYMMKGNSREFENDLKKKIAENSFYGDDEESIVLNIMRNSNIQKKIKTFELFLNNNDQVGIIPFNNTDKNEDFDFNVKNSKGQTNSQILIADNPTNAEFILLEKIENFRKWITNENSFLFKNKSGRNYMDNDISLNKSHDAKLIEREIKNFIKTPEESYKIGFADIEYNLIKLNLKLRRMYEINPYFMIKETPNEEKERLSKIHLKTLEDVIFDKLLLEKI